jgi:hypothetical protein
VLTQLKSGIAKVRYLLTEYRSSPRRCCEVALTIFWKDDRGRVVHAKARCLNISYSGAGIEYRQYLAKRSLVRI